MGTLLVGLGIGAGLVALPVVWLIAKVRKDLGGSSIGSDHP